MDFVFGDLSDRGRMISATSISIIHGVLKGYFHFLFPKVCFGYLKTIRFDFSLFYSVPLFIIHLSMKLTNQEKKYKAILQNLFLHSLTSPSVYICLIVFHLFSLSVLLSNPNHNLTRPLCKVVYSHINYVSCTLQLFSVSFPAPLKLYFFLHGC